MTDQLSLRLEPDPATLPNLPGALRPMLSRPLAEPFDSAEHLFEPSWGGLRALAFIGPAERPGAGDVRLVDADGRELAGALPELAGLAVRVDARAAILDGELVLVDADGRGDPDALAARLAGRPGRAVAYLAFDLLHLDGKALLSLPLTRRRALLRRVLHPADEVLAVPAIPGEGRALFDAVVAQGIAGVMARQGSSPYLPGIRSSLWRFVDARPAARRLAGDGPKAAEASAAAAVDGADGGEAAPASGPVIALIRRLPLLDLDDE